MARTPEGGREGGPAGAWRTILTMGDLVAAAAPPSIVQEVPNGGSFRTHFQSVLSSMPEVRQRGVQHHDQPGKPVLYHPEDQKYIIAELIKRWVRRKLVRSVPREELPNIIAQWQERALADIPSSKFPAPGS